jgi:TolA-binding protein
MRAIAIILLSVTILAACQSPKEKALKNIKNLESNDSAFSTELMTDLKMAYLDFAKAYPDDEMTPEFMFKGAQRAIVLEQANEAVDLLQQLCNKYPKSNFVEDATFLMAYTYENNLNDLNKSQALYKDFIAKYPNGELAKDAQFALDNLGKSPEEMLNIISEE